MSRTERKPTFDPNEVYAMVDSKRKIWSPEIIEADRAEHVFCSPSCCIGANALRRLPDVYDARVGAGIVKLLVKKDGEFVWERLTTHLNTKATIKAYDNEKALLPVGFRLQLLPPPPSRQLGARNGTASGSNKRSKAQTSVATRRPSHRNINVEPLV